MSIQTISDPMIKQTIARGVLESLTEWFGIVDAREKYILESAELLFIGAFDLDRPVGFLTLKETGKDTVELHVMGVLKEHQHHGVGKALIDQAKRIAIEQGYSFLQVKTVQMGKYPEYDQTNRFYLSCGFKEFEVFPTLWDAWNPCQIYVISLELEK